jgi:Uma2 family endonuclease
MILTTETTLPKISTSFPVRMLTVTEYHLMGELGILKPDEKVELIEGQIINKMAPQGSYHSAAITRSNRLFGNSLGNNVLIRLQLPVVLNNFSEPEPDIAVVKADPYDYNDAHPTAKDVYLIIEIADSTLRTDTEIKRKLYAQSGIKDYWVLDVNNRQLYVYRDPNQEDYETVIVLSDDIEITPLEFPECKINVSQMLRPKS